MCACVSYPDPNLLSSLSEVIVHAGVTVDCKSIVWVWPWPANCAANPTLRVQAKLMELAGGCCAVYCTCVLMCRGSSIRLWRAHGRLVNFHATNPKRQSVR